MESSTRESVTQEKREEGKGSGVRAHSNGAERFKEGKCQPQALAIGETNEKSFGPMFGQLDFPIRSVLVDLWLVVARASNLEARG